MDDSIIQSFKTFIQNAQKPDTCVARVKNGRTCKIRATCGRFCKKHVHLEETHAYMIRPEAAQRVVYHCHAPLITCFDGCPRFTVQ